MNEKLKSRIIVGADAIADYLDGGREKPARRFIGPKGVKRLIKIAGLPAKQIYKSNAPYTITEEALLEWHKNCEAEKTLWARQKPQTRRSRK